MLISLSFGVQDQKKATRDNVERKQARTAGELEVIDLLMMLYWCIILYFACRRKKRKKRKHLLAILTQTKVMLFRTIQRIFR